MYVCAGTENVGGDDGGGPALSDDAFLLRYIQPGAHPESKHQCGHHTCNVYFMHTHSHALTHTLTCTHTYTDTHSHAHSHALTNIQSIFFHFRKSFF